MKTEEQKYLDLLEENKSGVKGFIIILGGIILLICVTLIITFANEIDKFFGTLIK